MRFKPALNRVMMNKVFKNTIVKGTGIKVPILKEEEDKIGENSNLDSR